MLTRVCQHCFHAVKSSILPFLISLCFFDRIGSFVVFALLQATKSIPWAEILPQRILGLKILFHVENWISWRRGLDSSPKSEVRKNMDNRKYQFFRAKKTKKKFFTDCFGFIDLFWRIDGGFAGLQLAYGEFFSIYFSVFCFFGFWQLLTFFLPLFLHSLVLISHSIWQFIPACFTVWVEKQLFTVF